MLSLTKDDCSLGSPSAHKYRSGAVFSALKRGVNMLQRKGERPFWGEVNEGCLVAFLQEFSWRQQHQQLSSALGK